MTNGNLENGKWKMESTGRSQACGFLLRAGSKPATRRGDPACSSFDKRFESSASELPSSRRAALCDHQTTGRIFLVGPGANPGYPSKVVAVHSQTLPIIWRQPNALSPSGNASASIRPIALQSRFACAGVGELLPQGYRRLLFDMSARQLKARNWPPFPIQSPYGNRLPAQRQ